MNILVVLFCREPPSVVMFTALAFAGQGERLPHPRRLMGVVGIVKLDTLGSNCCPISFRMLLPAVIFCNRKICTVFFFFFASFLSVFIPAMAHSFSSFVDLSSPVITRMTSRLRTSSPKAWL